MADQGLVYDTYKDDGVALFRVEGTDRHNRKAIQVGLVSISPFIQNISKI